MKILASDYDETLYIDEKISPRDLRAIEDFQQRGNLFGINSGRHLDSIFEECQRFNIRCDFYIGNNGTVVLNKKREIVYISNFDHQLVDDVLAYFREHLRDDVYFISVNNGYQFGREFFNEGSDFLPDHTDSINNYLNKHVSTMFAQVLDPKQTMPIVRQLNEVFKERAFFYGNSPFIDIANEEIDKAIGLEKLIEHYGLPKKNAYVIGDSYNDISMLSHFNSFVMSHAKDSVKEFADREVMSVAQAIYTILKEKQTGGTKRLHHSK